jgi:outer membrane protein TolC
MKRNSILIIILAQFLTFLLVGQAPLSVEEAIQIGLENNYDIRIARNNEAIAKNNNTAGNAGFLPSASIFGSANYSSNNTTQKFFSGQEQMRTGAGNTSVRMGATVSWTAFDGFKMYAVRDRLNLTEQKSKAMTKSEMQDLVFRIQSSYQDLIRINQQIANTRSSIQLNESLYQLAQQKLNLGATTRLEVLQSANRVKADSAQLLNHQNQLALVKISFNRLLLRDAETLFNVDSTFIAQLLPNYQTIAEMAMQQNDQLALLSFDEKIALAQIKEARAQLFPTFDLNAGFNYNWSKSEAGFLLSNRTFGPTIGFSANYDIFTGRDLKKDIRNVELFQENILLTRQELEADLKTQLASLYQNYQALEDLKRIEISNLQTAEQNTGLARELYRSGRATNFEVREAIFNETQVKDRLSDTTYRQKLTEIEIFYLAGILIR